MHYYLSFLALYGAATASIVLTDPSDDLTPLYFVSDNAILADYSPIPTVTQPRDLAAGYHFIGDGNETVLTHTYFSNYQNDTSVIVVAGGAELNLSYVDIVKYGYSTNLIDASFWGFNAAINVANASTGHFDHMNITTHNGAANVYVYGTDSIIYVSNSWLYSSGPVAHGVYASGNGTAYVNNVEVFTGGNRCSSFSGDSPKGYLHISDSVAHTAGVGSAVFYVLGEIYADNVVGIAEHAPVAFMDGAGLLEVNDSDVTAGLLGGIIIFSSSVRTSGSIIRFTNSKLTTVGSTIPGLWFGNVIADVSLFNTEIKTDSGILVSANFSQVTQDFDYYASYTDNPSLSPAIVTVSVTESSLIGDLLAFNGSTINWNLASYSNWTGAAYSGYGEANFNVYLDETSGWTLTKDTKVQNITSASASLSGINSNGFTLNYNKTALSNGWLAGQTIALSGGGKAVPY